MKSAQAIHDLILNYNWDDGFAPVWPIVETDETEFATALLIYWRLKKRNTALEPTPQGAFGSTGSVRLLLRFCMVQLFGR